MRIITNDEAEFSPSDGNGVEATDDRGFNGRVVCLPVAITRDEGPMRARIFRIILPYKRLSSKLIAPTAHAKPNKCNRAHRLYLVAKSCAIAHVIKRVNFYAMPRTIKQRWLAHTRG